ncbi:MAG: 3-hydroxyacyl-CoA dehydrogenase NAD-binding domain-containing protein [Bacteroidota bacterium]
MNIGVLGSGSMGSGIAQVAATAGHAVAIYDNNKAALERAEQKLEKILNRLVEKERITAEEKTSIMGRITFVDSMYAYKDADLVIEAIVENMDIKKGVFEQLEDIVKPTCILATNTSSLSVSGIASACKQAQRVLGIHFFNPAPLMKLVEIIPALQSDPKIVEQATDLIKSWGKTTVLAKDTPGFIVNRVARPFYGEALQIYEEGIADFATIDWALKELGGFRMGPFTLMDYIGNDVNFAVTSSVFASFFYDPRYRPSQTQRLLSEAGYLGRKSGQGYYEYGEGAAEPQPNTDPILGKQIVDRVVVMLINEAADALYLKIANREDIDLAMTTGVNYPKGLLAWADEIGIDKCVQALDALFTEYHDGRYRCSPLLRQMAKTGQTFY